MKKKYGSNYSQIETSNQVFRQAILTSLSKLNDQHTVKTGLDEIREILSCYATDNERVGIAVLAIQESNNNITNSSKGVTKKENIKLIGLLSNVFEDRLVEWFPRVLAILQKKICVSDNAVSQVISETFGQLIEFTLKNLDIGTSVKCIELSLKSIQQAFQSGQLQSQQTAAMCLQRVIQSSPIQTMLQIKDIVAQFILDLTSAYPKAAAPILEGLLALIMGIEDQFKPYVEQTIPVLLSHANNSTWSVRKVSLDVIYTLTVFSCDELQQQLPEIIEVLNTLKFDKIKHVRDSALAALTALKEKLEDQCQRIEDEKKQAQLEKQEKEAASQQMQEQQGKQKRGTSNQQKIKQIINSNSNQANNGTQKTKKLNLNNDFDDKNDHLESFQSIQPSVCSERFQQPPPETIPERGRLKKGEGRNVSTRRNPSTGEGNAIKEQSSKPHQSLNRNNINPAFLKNAVKGDVEIKEGKKDSSPEKQKFGSQPSALEQLNQNQDEEKQQRIRQFQQNRICEDLKTPLNQNGEPIEVTQKQIGNEEDLKSQEQLRNLEQQLEYQRQQKQQQQQDNNEYLKHQQKLKKKEQIEQHQQQLEEQSREQENEVSDMARRSIMRSENKEEGEGKNINKQQKKEMKEIKKKQDILEMSFFKEIDQLQKRVVFLEETVEKLYQSEAQSQQLIVQFLNYKLSTFQQQMNDYVSQQIATVYTQIKMQQNQQLFPTFMQPTASQFPQLLDFNAFQQQPQFNNPYFMQQPSQFSQQQPIIQPQQQQQQQNMMQTASFSKQQQQFQQQPQNSQDPLELQSKANNNNANQYYASFGLAKKSKQFRDESEADNSSVNDSFSSSSPSLFQNKIISKAPPPQNEDNPPLGRISLQQQQQQQQDNKMLPQSQDSTNKNLNFKKVNNYVSSNLNKNIENLENDKQSNQNQLNKVPLQDNQMKVASSNSQQSLIKGSTSQDQISSALAQDDINQAFKIALQCNDNSILSHLIVSTGVNCMKLEKHALDQLFGKLSGLIEKQQQVSSVLELIDQGLQLKLIPISEKQNLIASLQQMVDNKNILIAENIKYQAATLISKLQIQPNLNSVVPQQFTINLNEIKPNINSNNRYQSFNPNQINLTLDQQDHQLMQQYPSQQQPQQQQQQQLQQYHFLPLQTHNNSSGVNIGTSNYSQLLSSGNNQENVNKLSTNNYNNTQNSLFNYSQDTFGKGALNPIDKKPLDLIESYNIANSQSPPQQQQNQLGTSFGAPLSSFSHQNLANYLNSAQPAGYPSQPWQ